MRAVVVAPDGRPSLERIPLPAGDGKLVRVRACGLCGSDVEKLGRVPAGTVLGHEVVAEVEGEARAALIHHLPCGECPRCRAGHESTCEAFRAATIEPGGFAEFARARAWVELPDSLEDRSASFAEPLACVLRAAERVPRGRVLVVGCGFAGLLFVQVLARRGDDVSAVDPLAERLELARGAGAAPPDGSFDAAVLCAHDGANEALARLEPGGTLLAFAAPPELVPIDLDAIYRRELHLVGSRSATPRHLRAAVALLPELASIPTVVLPLERFEEGLDLYRSRRAVKVVFTP